MSAEESVESLIRFFPKFADPIVRARLMVALEDDPEVLADRRCRVMDVLFDGPCTYEELEARSGLSTDEVSCTLCEIRKDWTIKDRLGRDGRWRLHLICDRGLRAIGVPGPRAPRPGSPFGGTVDVPYAPLGGAPAATAETSVSGTHEPPAGIPGPLLIILLGIFV